MRISPALQEYADAWKFSNPASPYTRGFEDVKYFNFYLNPFAPGTVEWHQYNAGCDDAHTARHAERTQH